MQDLGGTAQKNARMRKGKADVVSLTGSGKDCTKALFIVLLLVFIVYVRVPTCVLPHAYVWGCPQPKYGDQRTIVWSLFSSSTLWVPDIRLRLPFLVARIFVC